MAGTPSVVTVDVWRVSTARIPQSVAALGADRLRLRGRPGLTFAKLLGTASGRTFAARDTTPHRWALLAVWDAPQAAQAFQQSRVFRGWERRSEERLSLVLRPLSSRGEWSRQEPFGRPTASPVVGPVAAVTRARLRPRLAATFWRAVPPVADELHSAAGVRLSLGIGEAPIGWQGTFSLWEDEESLTNFAYRAPEHRQAIRQTHDVGWYAEELFARLAVESCEGTLDGRNPLEGLVVR